MRITWLNLQNRNRNEIYVCTEVPTEKNLENGHSQPYHQIPLRKLSIYCKSEDEKLRRSCKIKDQTIAHLIKECTKTDTDNITKQNFWNAQEEKDRRRKKKRNLHGIIIFVNIN